MKRYFTLKECVAAYKEERSKGNWTEAALWMALWITKGGVRAKARG